MYQELWVIVPVWMDHFPIQHGKLMLPQGGYPTSYIQTKKTPSLVAEVPILVPLFKYMPSKKSFSKKHSEVNL